mmetsp:Transcript_37656/g.118730  ORF Transcript_37656/g.118730 Transcript_37656/m.118730 type:complete len:314 (+) Transcript_37656:1073-2014(+)
MPRWHCQDDAAHGRPTEGAAAGAGQRQPAAVPRLRDNPRGDEPAPRRGGAVRAGRALRESSVHLHRHQVVRAGAASHGQDIHSQAARAVCACKGGGGEIRRCSGRIRVGQGPRQHGADPARPPQQRGQGLLHRAEEPQRGGCQHGGEVLRGFRGPPGVNRVPAHGAARRGGVPRGGSARVHGRLRRPAGGARGAGGLCQVRAVLRDQGLVWQGRAPVRTLRAARNGPPQLPQVRGGRDPKRHQRRGRGKERRPHQPAGGFPHGRNGRCAEGPQLPLPAPHGTWEPRSGRADFGAHREAGAGNGQLQARALAAL